MKAADVDIAQIWPELRFMSRGDQEAEVLKKFDAVVLRYAELADELMTWAAAHDLDEDACRELAHLGRYLYLTGVSHGDLPL